MNKKISPHSLNEKGESILRLISVTGTHDHEGLYTWEAYQELRLQMSTGDFHVHKAAPAECGDAVSYFDLDEQGNIIFIE